MTIYRPYNEYHFFYGGPFSQWLTCYFEIDGVKYNCAEQYMMAQKARLFTDSLALEKIMAAGHPSVQKATGKQVRGFVKDLWDAVARDIVYRGSMAKFTQNPELMRNLLDTKGKLLVEASPTDAIWGIKMGEGAEGIEDPNNWQGTNWLGEILTKVRDDLSYWMADFHFSSVVTGVTI